MNEWVWVWVCVQCACTWQWENVWAKYILNLTKQKLLNRRVACEIMRFWTMHTNTKHLTFNEVYPKYQVFFIFQVEFCHIEVQVLVSIFFFFFCVRNMQGRYLFKMIDLICRNFFVSIDDNKLIHNVSVHEQYSLKKKNKKYSIFSCVIWPFSQIDFFFFWFS